MFKYLPLVGDQVLTLKGVSGDVALSCPCRARLRDSSLCREFFQGVRKKTLIPALISRFTFPSSSRYLKCEMASPVANHLCITGN
jgi:hypothetical protein